MSTPTTSKTRSERAASFKIDQQSWHDWVERITQYDSILRFAAAIIAAAIVTIFVQGWEPPFAYREGFVPQRAILARVPFKVEDEVKTDALRIQAAREVLCIYENRKEPLVQLRGAIKDSLFAIRDAADSIALTKLQTQILDSFGVTVLDMEETPLSYDQALDAVKKTLSTDADISKYDSAMREILDPLEEFGLLISLSHDSEKGNQRFIRVIQLGNETSGVEVDLPRTRIAEVGVTLKGSLEREFKNQFGTPSSVVLSRMVHNYLASHLPVTLTLREDLSNKARLDAINNVKPALITYDPAFSALVPIGKPLGAKEMTLLLAEHQTYTSQMSWVSKLQRLAAFVGMITALYFLCGFFIYQSLDQRIISQTTDFIRLLCLCVVAIIVSVLCAQDPFRAEIIPVTLCAITATIAYGRPTALMLMAAVSLVIAFSTRVDLSEFILLASAAAGSILLCGRIRNRTRLIYVGLGVGVVVFATYLGLGVMTGQSGGGVIDGPATGALSMTSMFPLRLMQEAARQAAFVILCGPLMAGLLPLVEKAFDVQTDLSLLELSDMSHPLLRQLAQRAPGTYNHSISVAALAESAAEAIGAHGLLVRVGACFHDIGKMFKPNYFVENQLPGANRHDTLQPAMSTLVIIAHVKDGADLARQHSIPQRVIDFIEQHHGTTLVEYFYRQATKKSEESEDGEEISETSFRYPGPKPQTREAAVLMISDAVESASRALVEPTSSRIQNLVDQIAMKKLLDGQFDECGLTLRELDTIKMSLVKSLNAIYHGRIKYPDQQSAG
jgi:putative nucleotidyltransferase with HDIG domain